MRRFHKTLLLAVPFLLLAAGCNQQSSKSTADEGKTYTSPQKGAPGGTDSSSGGTGTAQTTSGQPSAASDSGTSDATKGQSVMNPGAPAPQPKH